MHKGLCFFSIIIFLGAGSFAADLGVQAQVFPIQEEAFTKMMQRKLANIDMEEHQSLMQRKVEERVKNPVPVAGIIPAREDRSFLHDPAYVLDEDIYLPCGKLLYKSGTRVNPLDHMDLERRIIFVDGRREEQKEWLAETLDNPVTTTLTDEYGNERQVTLEDRVILVAGSPFKIMEELGVGHKDKVFFDQKGELTTKFGINASPAIAMQEKRFLRIEEIAIKLNNKESLYE